MSPLPLHPASPTRTALRLGALAAGLLLAACLPPMPWRGEAGMASSAPPPTVPPASATLPAASATASAPPSPQSTADVPPTTALATHTPPAFPSPTTPVGPQANPPGTYRAQGGDTLPALAVRFDVPAWDLRQLNPDLPLTRTLEPGTPVVLPADWQPYAGPLSGQLLPDSRVVYALSAVAFDVQAFVESQPGFLAGYLETPEAAAIPQPGWQIVQAYARDYSLDPRLLLSLLELRTRALSEPAPPPESLARALGAAVPNLPPGLGHQLGWAANRLNYHYYRWRAGTGARVWWPGRDESLPVDPRLNAGSYAVLSLLAELYPPGGLERAAADFRQAYRRLFGDALAAAPEPLVPGGLAQPALQLPFEPGRAWYFTSGPHPGWGHTLPLAALDFAPPASEPGCADSGEWLVAVAQGVVTRSEPGLLELAVGEGWSVVYLHVATVDRAPAGARVSAGDRLGHPSCEGGSATAVHVHLARKHNGEWIAADGPAPFNLSGWTARAGERSYQGTLVRAGRAIQACACGGLGTAVGLEPSAP